MTELVAQRRMPSAQAVAQASLVALPVVLFFPQPFCYMGLAIYCVALLASGDLRARFKAVGQHPVFLPVMAMLAICMLAALFLDRPNGDFASGFAHYQSYLVLLLFLAIGPGQWQQRAVSAFYVGAVIAAGLFYLNALKLLPNIWLFGRYTFYGGNKSILLGILLSVAAGWMLYDLMTASRRRWPDFLRLAWVSVPAVTLTKTRTGLLLFFLLCAFALFSALKSTARRVVFAALLLAMAGLAFQAIPSVQKRVALSVSDAGNFLAGKPVSNEGIRLDMYRVTTDVVREKPWFGHGIGTWIHNYAEKIKGTDVPMHSTPHNDYLLYLAELGVVGLLGLFWIWAAQLASAAKMGGAMGARLAMLTIAMAVAAMFNAVLRDAVFALPFMILLAIPLAGASPLQRAPAARLAESKG